MATEIPITGISDTATPTMVITDTTIPTTGVTIQLLEVTTTGTIIGGTTTASIMGTDSILPTFTLHLNEDIPFEDFADGSSNMIGTLKSSASVPEKISGVNLSCT